MATSFTWKGKTLNTMGEVMSIVEGIETAEEAKLFLAEYEKVTPHARANIGYASGYYSQETSRKMLSLFDLPHPVFGRR